MSARPELEAAVRHLAAIDRPSASEGERQAAEWIAQELRERGCRDVAVEEERAHGTYWWPLGLLSAVGVVAGLLARGGRRRLGAALGAFAAAGIYDDVGGGALWFRRRFLPQRSTWNVVAEAGDADARETLVLLAHHDAARSGAIYNPAIPRFVGRRFPGLLERANTSPPLLALVFAGPALVTMGSLRGARRMLLVGTVMSLGSAATFAEIATRDTVPGANDNLTGVATLLGVADALSERPVEGLRVLLVSNGSEESFEEGMDAFGARHFDSLPPARTRFLCVDTVGSPRLTAPESEGMLVPRNYDGELKDLMSRCAEEAGIDLGRGLRFSFASDALIPLRAGYRTAMLGSVDELKAPANYHWPTDVPDNVDFDRVADAVRLCGALIRRLGESAAPAPA